MPGPYWWYPSLAPRFIYERRRKHWIIIDAQVLILLELVVRVLAWSIELLVKLQLPCERCNMVRPLPYFNWPAWIACDIHPESAHTFWERDATWMFLSCGYHMRTSIALFVVLLLVRLSVNINLRMAWEPTTGGSPNWLILRTLKKIIYALCLLLYAQYSLIIFLMMPWNRLVVQDHVCFHVQFFSLTISGLIALSDPHIPSPPLSLRSPSMGRTLGRLRGTAWCQISTL